MLSSQTSGGNYERLVPLGDISTPLYGVPTAVQPSWNIAGLPLDEIEDLLPRSSAYRQAARMLFPEPAAFKVRPATPLHGGHVALCAVSGMLNGVFGSGKDLVSQRGRRSRLLIARRKPRRTIIQRERERFTNELTLVCASGETAILR